MTKKNAPRRPRPACGTTHKHALPPVANASCGRFRGSLGNAWGAVGIVLLPAAIVATLAAGACENGESAQASGGSVPSGGGTTTSSTSPTIATGLGGAHDAGLDASGGGGFGGSGSDPVWAPFAGELFGCQVERMTNAPQVRAFQWQACPGQSDCTEMVPSAFVGALGETNVFEAGLARSTDVGTMVALTLYTYPDHLVLFARDDGWLVRAYRVHEEGGCLAGIPAVSSSRYGLVVAQGEAMMEHLGGLLGSLDGAEAASAFEVTPVPYGVGPQIWNALGDERWVWQFYVPRLVSVSADDGSGFYEIAKSTAAGPILDVNFPCGPGNVFYFEQVNLVPPDGVQGTIAQSNGVEPPTPYLTPQDGSYYGRPAFAHSDIAWLRGTGQTDVNHFATVELWASPYSPNPAELAPHKVDDLPTTGMTWLQGGHGYAATVSLLDPPEYDETAVWRLADGMKRTFPFPEGLHLNRYLGITPAHVWAVGGDGAGMTPQRIVRFAL